MNALTLLTLVRVAKKRSYHNIEIWKIIPQLTIYIYHMKIWTYRNLREKTTDELLDLLSNYLYLQTDILKLISVDVESSKFYNKEHLVNYELNIRKIQNELVVKSLKN